MKNSLPILIVMIIWGGSTLLTGAPFFALENASQGYKLIYLCFAPAIFVLSFATIAGLISRLAKRGIIAGKFPREPMNPIYFLRRIFNGCWTQLYYFKPVYSAVLAIPALRKWVFRLFGYKGNMDFIVYPDTWIRDIPLLNIEKGTYLANRATIGTNLCLSDGTILVQGFTFGENTMIGHMALLAPGSTYEKDCEIGTNAICGIRVKVSEGAKIHPVSAVNHGAKIGKNSKVGTNAYIGVKSVIGDNIDVPAGAFITDGTVIDSQEEMNIFYSAETGRMKSTKSNIANLLKKEIGVS